MSIGQHFRKNLFFYLIFCIFTISFLIYPKISFADVELENRKVKNILKSAFYKPITDNRINLFYNSDADSIKEEVALIIIKQGIQIELLDYAFKDLPLEYLKFLAKNTGFILKLYYFGTPEYLIKELEKKTIKEAKKIIKEWMEQNEIKVSAGTLKKFSYTSLYGNKQEVNLGYSIVYKPLGQDSADVLVEIYSPFSVEPPKGESHYFFSLGNSWTFEDWLRFGYKKLDPFILRIKARVKENPYGGYKWINYSLEVVFDEPVPIIKEPSFWDKIKDYIKKKINEYNPFSFFKADISGILSENDL